MAIDRTPPTVIIPFPQFPPFDVAKTVAVFGAGVAGLTAAHELVERGYSVVVYECAPPSPLEDECSIGGMARTQWSRAARAGVPPFKDTRKRVRTDPIDWHVEDALKRRIRFKVGAKPELTPESAEHEQSGEVVLGQLLKALQNSQEYSRVFFEVRGFQESAAQSPLPDPARWDVQRAKLVADEINKLSGYEGKASAIGWGLGASEDWTLPASERAYVEVRANHDYIPGEHGYRFFPTFYRNLRETLKRIPIPEERETFVETSRTVYDNLVPTTSQGVSFAGKKPYVLPRRPLLSAQEFFDLLVEALRKSKFTIEDTNRLAVKTFKFMTSCAERRREYEDISWWDFIGGEDYSANFQRLVQHVAQAFVAMTVKECDARTYGDVSIQLYRDQFRAGERTDSVLNGPTSVAWFTPWRRYLESQGVTFVRGKLVGFEISPDETMLWPKVVLGDDIEKDDANPKKRWDLIQASYYVIALNIEAMHELANGTYGGKQLKGSDFRRLRELLLGDPTVEKPDGVLHHLSGIQFYFQSEFKIVPGHTVFANAPWGLSSIYQPQFWLRKRGWWDGYRGVMSVCIGKWHGDVPNSPDAPWNCTPDDIAQRTWNQIVESVPPAERHRLPTPTLYHIDDNIVFGPRPQPPPRPLQNDSRMFVNLPKTQRMRPGRLIARPTDPESGSPHLDGYELWYGNVVLAGTYMQTFTRLTTMEAANESARHAVNGILRVDAFQGDRCAIFDPEDDEFEDLKYLIDIDRELRRENLPHLVDILDIKTLTKQLLRGELDLDLLGLIPGIRR